ncbi:Uncharacterised protein [Acidipropionibacterium jensenii]|uniref:Uncharacterized protein n=2 Tax=Acidipropionibacterium jensenii TaxID=1749 RepID=A0A448NYN6_9ACTN|nr:Uncharacterised protein [Acidipropionibacterium jensenii]
MPVKFVEQSVMAVTTTSSAVTFPTILRNAVEKFGVSPSLGVSSVSAGGVVAG